MMLAGEGLLLVVALKRAVCGRSEDRLRVRKPGFTGSVGSCWWSERVGNRERWLGICDGLVFVRIL